MIGWLYPVWHKIVYLDAYGMPYNVGHQVGNACWQHYETFLEGTFVYCWIAKLFPPIVIFAIVQPRYDLPPRFVFLVSLGGSDYPWKIVGMDLSTSLYGPKFHFTITIDSYLPFEMVHFLSYHKKSPLTKQ